MKRSILITLILACISFVCIAQPAFAVPAQYQIDTGSQGLNVSNNQLNVSNDGLNVTNKSSGQSGSLTNPLQATSISELFLSVIDIILTFAIPIIVLFIMYAGFLYATARGNESQISKAHQALLWSIIGGVIVLGAKLIIQVIQGTVNSI